MFGLGVLDFSIVVDSIVTVIAVNCAINAFHMVDGIDGLLGVKHGGIRIVRCGVLRL